MMQPFGKTYLVKVDKQDGISNEDGIFVINNIDKIKDTFWKGTIVSYGVKFTDEEVKELLPIGTKVVMSYGKENSDKGGVKLVLGNSIYYIRNAEEILGVLEDE